MNFLKKVASRVRLTPTPSPKRSPKDDEGEDKGFDIKPLPKDYHKKKRQQEREKTKYSSSKKEPSKLIKRPKSPKSPRSPPPKISPPKIPEKKVWLSRSNSERDFGIKGNSVKIKSPQK